MKLLFLFLLACDPTSSAKPEPEPEPGIKGPVVETPVVVFPKAPDLTVTSVTTFGLELGSEIYDLGYAPTIDAFLVADPRNGSLWAVGNDTVDLPGEELSVWRGEVGFPLNVGVLTTPEGTEYLSGSEFGDLNQGWLYVWPAALPGDVDVAEAATLSVEGSPDAALFGITSTMTATDLVTMQADNLDGSAVLTLPLSEVGPGTTYGNFEVELSPVDPNESGSVAWGMLPHEDGGIVFVSYGEVLAALDANYDYLWCVHERVTYEGSCPYETPSDYKAWTRLYRVPEGYVVAAMNGVSDWGPGINDASRATVVSPSGEILREVDGAFSVASGTTEDDLAWTAWGMNERYADGIFGYILIEREDGQEIEVQFPVEGEYTYLPILESDGGSQLLWADYRGDVGGILTIR